MSSKPLLEGGNLMKKVQIKITRIYPKGKKGQSKSMTIEGIGLTDAYDRIKELMEAMLKRVD